MFKPVHNAQGVLTANVLSVSNVLPVDATLYNAIVAILGVGGTDHTYLRIGEWPNIEVVKVQQASAGTLIVERGEDGTAPQGFSSGAELVYLFCSQAAQDLIQQLMAVSVTLTGEAPIIVEQIATNNFKVSLNPLALSSDDNSILIIGTWPNIQLAINSANAGCCT